MAKKQKKLANQVLPATGAKSAIKTTVRTKPSRSIGQFGYWPLVIALLLIVIGTFGLVVVRQKPIKTSNQSNTGGLVVIQPSSSSLDQNQSNSGAAAQLQNAARTSDLIQSKSGNNVQSGGSVDSLLSGKTLK